MQGADLFGESRSELPSGLRYDSSFIGDDAAERLTDLVAALPFKEFEFHGFLGKRRVVSFGWKYDFSTQRLREVEPIPHSLLPVREQAGKFAGLDGDALEQVLVTEYAPGAAIGWHKDKAVFDKVVGISLGSACTMRFRQKAGDGWQRLSLRLEAGSAYLISGPARSDWEHSIPPVEALRYSITFRSIR